MSPYTQADQRPLASKQMKNLRGVRHGEYSEKSENDFFDTKQVPTGSRFL